jgi:hypothetical protein
VTPLQQFLQLFKPLRFGFQEYMTWIIDQSAEHVAGFAWRFCVRDHGGIAGEPDESSLSQ